MSDYWDGRQEEETEDIRDNSDTIIRINGANLNLTPGDDFKNTIKNHAEEAGLGKFRVFLNGSEIRPNEAPNVIEEGMKVEVKPYDIAG